MFGLCHFLWALILFLEYMAGTIIYFIVRTLNLIQSSEFVVCPQIVFSCNLTSGPAHFYNQLSNSIEAMEFLRESFISAVQPRMRVTVSCPVSANSFITIMRQGKASEN